MPSFAASELTQALSEVPWGIRTHRMLPSDTAEEARAEVDLLEGYTAVVSCREGGWSVVDAEGDCPKPRSVFETLDDLLLAISPAFDAKRIEKLFEKLNAVAEQQREEDD
ncbi:hypothetical protein JCM6882_006365 [Rhodosporidiobolus microsporus]